MIDAFASDRLGLDRSSNPRVAVLRALPGVGDLLCAVPALRSLRAGLPRAHVTLVGLAGAAWFVERFGRYVDDLLEVPAFPGLAEVPADPVRALAFLEEAQARRFDLVVQLHGSGSVSNVLASLLGAAAVAGHHLPALWCPDPARFRPYPGTGPEIERLAGLLHWLGLPDTGTELELPLTDDDERACDRLHDRARPYAVVHPGASIEARRWDPGAFARVVDQLAGRGLDVVLTGTSGERATTAAVAAASAAPARDLAGCTTLGALGVLVRDATLVVCNDTGVSHVAAALGTPSVIVFRASDSQRWAPLDAERHRVVHAGNAFERASAVSDAGTSCLRDGCARRPGPASDHHHDAAAAVGRAVDHLLAEISGRQPSRPSSRALGPMG